MTCRELIDFLMQYQSGELPADERRAFDHHLTLCTACRNYLATYDQSIALAKQAHEAESLAAEMPADLTRAILASRANLKPRD